MSRTFWIINPFDRLPSEGALPGRYTDLMSYVHARFTNRLWWTSDFDHTTKTYRETPCGQDQIDYRLITVRPYHRNISLQRLWSHRDFAVNVVGAIEALLGNGAPEPDVILVSTPPLDICWRLKMLPWIKAPRIVLDVQDCWPDAFAQFLPFGKRWNSIMAKPLFLPLRHLILKDLRSADAITAVSQTYLEWAMLLRRKACPNAVFRLGASLSSYREGSLVKENTGLLRLAYIGSLSTNYDLETLLAALKILLDEKRPVTLSIAGSGEMKEQFQQLAHRLSISDAVCFCGYLNGDELRDLLLQSDVGLNVIKPESLIVMPNKIGDYLYMGLPVVNSLVGELADMLEKYDCGLSYIAGDARSLADSISQYIKIPNLLSRQSLNAKTLGDAEFQRKQILSQFVDFLAA